MTRIVADAPLIETDAELTLIGSLLQSPDVFASHAADVDAAWFGEPFLRYLFEAASRLVDEGHALSAPAVIALMPEDCGGVSRSRLYGSARAAALPPPSIGGLIATVKDRWSRRVLLETADRITAAAKSLDVDPYEVAGEAMLSLDTVKASRAERTGGAMAQATRRLMDSLAQPVALRGASTGLLALDNKLNGYKAGQLYVIAGRPGMGKSAFMCSSLRRTAETGRGVAIFSLEMTAEEIAARCLSDSLDSPQGPFYGSILKGDIRVDQERFAAAVTYIDGLPMVIDDAPRLTLRRSRHELARPRPSSRRRDAFWPWCASTIWGW